MSKYQLKLSDQVIMKKVCVIIGLSILQLNAIAKEINKVIITDFQFYVRTSETVSENSFPNYANNPFFIKDISQEIKLLAREKFEVDTTVFLLPDSIEIKYGETPDDFRQKEYPGEDGTLRVAIRTMISVSHRTEFELVYKFITIVQARNSKGRIVYRFRNKIPFVALVGKEITGEIEMKQDDFYNFFFDGMRAAFYGQDPKLKKRYIFKPTTQSYGNFLVNSEEFVMLQEENILRFGKDTGSTRKVLEFDLSLLSDYQLPGEGLEGIFSGINTNKEIKLINYFNKKEYKIKLIGAKNLFLSIIQSKGQVELELYIDHDNVGQFIYDIEDNLIGDLHRNSYLVKWSETHDVIEIFAKDFLIALVKNWSNRQIIYLEKYITEKQLGDIFTLLFLYDFALLIREEAIAYIKY